jgi:3-oxoacyl-[acyl-carrier protein] reductase
MSKKIVLITGATRGIGASIAKKFINNNFYVIGTGTKKNINLDWVDEYWKCNFEDNKDIIICSKKINKIKPDILINNAGINIVEPFLKITNKNLLKILNVNLIAPFNLMQNAIPSMKKKKWGRIVNINSIWGKISKEHRASYSSSKFALDGLSLSAAIEFSKNGILINSVSPGFINTELTKKTNSKEQLRIIKNNIPINRLGNPEEISELVYFLASNKNTYISGQNITSDGGFSRA